MKTIQTSDDVLISRYIGGDKAAMDLLVSRHLPRVFAHAMRLSKNREVANDVVADTFIRVNRALASFNGRSAFTTWLHTLTRNCYLDTRQRALARFTESLDEPFAADTAQAESMVRSPYEKAESRARARALMVAVEQLPVSQRLLVEMFHAEMLTYDEIAGRLQIPTGTVKSRLHRARFSMRKTLEPDWYLLGLNSQPH